LTTCGVQAIQFIDSNERWGARVVYGDTDSLFVYLKGKTKDQAFRIGYDIADAVTKLNPVPIKLRFEKVRKSVFQVCLALGDPHWYVLRSTCPVF